MGIPSYFSYIIKNHSNIIRSWHYHRSVQKTKFTSMYMDCNSIVYDAVRRIEEEDRDGVADATDRPMDLRIIDAVVQKIKEYVRLIAPTHTVYIAFDGVAPFAKMEQQRTRRYKTAFLATLDFEHSRRLSEEELASSASKKWNTTAITPGTEFMSKLSKRMVAEFGKASGYAEKEGIRTVVVSAADKPGEGEHKMFQYLREHTSKHETIAVYGLDSDLIMLSIFHCFYCYNIHIFRESPAFSASILPANLRGQISPNEPLFLDTYRFSMSMLQEMHVGNTTPALIRMRIYDYVFMCFLLGNDFLPHFLALNIRNHGIQQIMDTYSVHIGAYPTKSLIDEASLTIRWEYVALFLSELAKHEHTFLLEEYKIRDRMSSRCHSADKTAEDRENAFQNTPLMMRADEKYICPDEQGWEERYYKTAFHWTAEEARDADNKTAVCRNYCEGLEWVFLYYTKGCPHWRWKYNYAYPPLLGDLSAFLAWYVAKTETVQFIRPDVGINRPFSQLTQLSYVIPKFQHGLLPVQMRERIRPQSALFPSLNCLAFKWLGCRYFWEAHPVLPDIPLSILETWERVV